MSSTTEALLIALPVLFFSMALHELMHGLVAYWLGDDTAKLQGRISLNPICHIDPLMTIGLPLLLILIGSKFIFGAAKPVQVNFSRLKYGEFGGAIVGMVGPLTNLFIAVVAALIFNHFTPEAFSTAYKVLGYVIIINVGFFVFNSIPWPPLDGSRLLYAFAPEPLQEFMMSIERTGLASLFIILILFSGFSTVFSNIFADVVNFLAPTLNLNLLLS